MRFNLPGSGLPPPDEHSSIPPNGECKFQNPDEVYLNFVKFKKLYGNLDTPDFKNVLFTQIESVIIERNEEIDFPLSVTLTTEW